MLAAPHREPRLRAPHPGRLLRCFPGLGTYCASKAAVERSSPTHYGSSSPTPASAWQRASRVLDTDLVRDTDAGQPVVQRSARRLRGPLGQTFSPRECAEALADAIAKRERRVYVPRSLVGDAGRCARSC